MRREPQMTGSGPGRRLRRLAVAAAAAVLLAAVGQAAAAAPVQAGVSRTSITVDRAHPFSRLPADFVGLSYEMRELASWCTTGDCTGNFDARTGNLVALYKNLGKSNVRIGGNQLDRDTLWLPAGQKAPTPLPDWVKDIVTHADIAADEARNLFAILGPRLPGAACGNEPNHYASNHYRPAPYGYLEHKRDWEACADVVGSTRMAAPDLSSPTSTADWFDQFAQAEHNRINMLTIHNYTGATTIGQLLSPEVYARQL